MRVNIYAEEMTDRIEIISKQIEGQQFTGLRFYLELPVTLNPYNVRQIGAQPNNISGPFLHRAGDDDSSAVTFWGKRDLLSVLCIAQDKLREHYTTGPNSRLVPALDLTGRQIKALWDFCDGDLDAEVTVGYGPALADVDAEQDEQPYPPGMRAWLTEYAEEGVIPL